MELHILTTTPQQQQQQQQQQRRCNGVMVRSEKCKRSLLLYWSSASFPSRGATRVTNLWTVLKLERDLRAYGSPSCYEHTIFQLSSQKTSYRGIWLSRFEIKNFRLLRGAKAFDSYIESGVTPKEEDIRGEIPAYQNGLYVLYATYVASCFVERLWRFAVPLVLASLHTSLLPVALTSFVGQPWYIVLLLAGAVERVTGLATGVAFERDWVVVLAGSFRTVALAKANAILRRVDLLCEMAGPLLFGILISNCDILFCINVVIVMMLVSLLLVIIFVQGIDRLSYGVLTRTKCLELSNISASCSFSNGLKGLAVSLVKNIKFIKHGWVAYLAQPVLPASLAYILLFFNAVLSPGGLMTSFLSQSGLNPSVITLFRGSCAMMGFVATFLSSRSIAKFGVLLTGAAALTFQMVLLLLTVIVHWSNPFGYPFSTYIVLILVAVSRLGYWAYDIANAQIFQMSMGTPQANLLGIMELSLASLAELAMMGIAVLLSDITHFGRLAALSMSAVAAAAFLYWIWLLQCFKARGNFSLMASILSQNKLDDIKSG